ncbi:MAG: FAD-dependent oxidoreductase [Lentisphaeria bacterium]|nr:FAD-dependent oxidoreductase [Lentisphaeria bacterium]
MREITIPAEKLQVAEEADVCVIGGSCTGVFAAVRAARLGAKVVIIEKHNRFGGTATGGLVCMWHSVFDITGEKQIIGGLTYEMMERLEKRGAIGEFRKGGPHVPRIPFNSAELTLELDALVAEEKGIRTFFHTHFSRPVMDENGAVTAVIAENKSGRFAVAAKFFIDASGDGLLCRSAGFPMRRAENPQPPTACAHIENYRRIKGLNLKELIEANRSRYPDLPCGYSWGTGIPGSDGVYMLAATRIPGCDCMEADAITEAEFESRRQLRALVDLLRETAPEAHISLQALPSEIGIRESRHIVSASPLRGREMLAGTRYADTVGAGTYPVDIHGDADDSITFMHLTGSKQYFRARTLVKEERWLPEGEFLPFYRIPLSSLIPRGAVNLISAGRMLDADADAFGAVRVMVNLNQCGEAAGVAACCALDGGKRAAEIDGAEVRRRLNRGGSLIPES